MCEHSEFWNADDEYSDLDDLYDGDDHQAAYAPVNYRMATLNRVAGQVNRHRRNLPARFSRERDR